MARNHSALFWQCSLKMHNVCLLKDLKLSQHLTLDGRELQRAATLHWKVSETWGITRFMVLDAYCNADVSCGTIYYISMHTVQCSSDISELRMYVYYTRIFCVNVYVNTCTYVRIYARVCLFVMHSHTFLYMKQCWSNKTHYFYGNEKGFKAKFAYC